MKSEYFSQNAMKGLERVGDILIPHTAELPSFSESRVAKGVDSLLAYAPADDIATLNTVLGIFSFLPGSVLRWVAERMAVSQQDAGALGALFRQLNLGLRGIIFSLYYGGPVGFGYQGKAPLDVIGYHINRVDS